jgi:hypothetical protein
MYVNAENLISERNLEMDDILISGDGDDLEILEMRHVNDRTHGFGKTLNT